MVEMLKGILMEATWVTSAELADLKADCEREKQAMNHPEREFEDLLMSTSHIGCRWLCLKTASAHNVVEGHWEKLYGSVTFSQKIETTFWNLQGAKKRLPGCGKLFFQIDPQKYKYRPSSKYNSLTYIWEKCWELLT